MGGCGRAGGGGGVGREGGRWEREMGNGRGGVEEGECVGRAGGEDVGRQGGRWEMEDVAWREMVRWEIEEAAKVISED